jgi:hypothetical protein
MNKDATGMTRGDIALENMQVAPAHPGLRNLDNRAFCTGPLQTRAFPDVSELQFCRGSTKFGLTELE